MNNNKCGAKTRSGNKCKNSAMPNGRCRLHGGKSLKGNQSPRYKHGLYSKYAGESLKKVLGELDGISSDELIQPEHEIRLMSALIMKCRALETGAQDLQSLNIISKILERLITAKQRSQAIMIEQQRLIPANEIRQFLDYVEGLLIDRYGSDSNQLIEKFNDFTLTKN